MGAISNGIYTHSLTCDSKDTRRFCLFLIILALGIVAIFSCIVIADAGDADVERFTVEGIVYETVSSSEVKVLEFKDSYKNGDVPSSVVYSGVRYDVISVRNNAFFNSEPLIDVVIEDGVTSISDKAFEGQTSLRSIKIPNSVKSIGIDAFKGCTSLESVVVPDSVESIAIFAFSGCTALKSVTIGKGVTSIGEYAFEECTSLETLTFGKCNVSICGYAFLGCTPTTVTILGNLTSLGYGAFYNCTFYDFDGETKLVDCQDLSGYTFSSTPSSKLIRMHRVTFDENGGSEAVAAMDPNDGEKFILPESPGTKVCYSFDGWSYGGKIYQPGQAVTKVSGNMKFTAVWSITTFTADGIKYMATSATTVKIVDCSKPVSRCLIIPSSIAYSGTVYNVTSIEVYAFYGCTFLSSVAIPDSVESIADYAFSRCTSLKTLTIGDGVTSIGNYAFSDCTRLKTLTIGKCNTSIGVYAFADSMPTTVTILGNFTSLGYGVFNNCTFYDFNGKTEIVDPLRLSGYTYSGTSSSKLIKTHKIVFDGNGGSVEIAGMDLDDGKIFTLPGCTRADVSYRFDGWLYDGTIYQPGDTMTKVRGQMRFTAVWTSMTFTADGIRYMLTSDTTVKIVDCPKPASGDIIIPSSVRYSGTVYDVVSIDDYAFCCCKTMISVSIPNSVISIGDSAFRSCTSMESVIIPDSVVSISPFAFANCTSLTSVTVGKGVTSIGIYAFDGCTSLTSVTILGNITSFGHDAFGDCRFYDFDGMTEIRDNKELSGFTYSGESPSKLVRHKLL